jgi:rhodanese-related sulfurtransferase
MQTVKRAAAGTVSPAGAEVLLALGGQLVDIRSPAAFRQFRLPGAVNLPVDTLCYEHARLNNRRPVIVYGGSEVRCIRAARLLAGKGFSSIYHLASHLYQ